VLALAVALRILAGTRPGAVRRWFDRFKLILPVVGTICRKVVLSRFARTFGTLLGSGVPILQALTIVKETAGNLIVGSVISKIHDSVKEGREHRRAAEGIPDFPGHGFRHGGRGRTIRRAAGHAR